MSDAQGITRNTNRTKLDVINEYKELTIWILTCISPLSFGGGGLGVAIGILRHDSVEQQSKTSTTYTVSSVAYSKQELQ